MMKLQIFVSFPTIFRGVRLIEKASGTNALLIRLMRRRTVDVLRYNFSAKESTVCVSSKKTVSIILNSVLLERMVS